MAKTQAKARSPNSKSKSNRENRDSNAKHT